MTRQHGRRYQAFPTAAQAETLRGWCGTLRELWNACLEERSGAWRWSRERRSFYDQSKALAEARRAVPRLAEVPQMAATQRLRDLDTAFQRFFAGLGGYPTWQRRDVHETVRVPARECGEIVRLNRDWAQVRFPKLGPVRFKLASRRGYPRLLDGRPVSVTLRVDRAGSWWVSFNVDADVGPVAHRAPGSKVGIDRGVAVTAATSRPVTVDGETSRLWAMPAPLTPGEKARLVALQQQLARQRRGSGRRARTKQAVAVLKRRQANRRRCWWHRFTSAAADQYETVHIEDLRVRGMTASAAGTTAEPGVNVAQKRGLNREVLDRAWGEGARQLAYKCPWRGGRLVAVPAPGTSRRCSNCGTTVVRSCQATVVCPRCGPRHADLNAAENVEAGQAAGDRARKSLRRAVRTPKTAGRAV